MALPTSLKRLRFNTQDNKGLEKVEVLYQRLSQQSHVCFCTSTKRHFYYMPKRVTHKNHLRESILN